MPKYDAEQMRKGLEVEREHEDTWEAIEPETTMTEREKEDAARMTVEDHLSEVPDYYDKLEKVEGEVERLENPVRRRPDYGASPFSDDDEARHDEDEDEQTRVVARLLEGYREGVFTELPLSGRALIDVLRECGASRELCGPGFLRGVSRRANRAASAIATGRRVAEGSLGACLARSFARAIEDGRLPRLASYARAQALEFVAGAVGDGPATERVLEDFALAHNLGNERHGVVEVGSARRQLLVSEASIDHVRAYAQQMGEFSEEQTEDELRLYPTSSAEVDLWKVVRSIEREFPDATAGVGDEGTELAHVWVREGREPTGPTREKWSV